MTKVATLLFKNNSFLIRVILVIFILLLMIVVGFIRNEFLLNFILSDKPFLISRFSGIYKSFSDNEINHHFLINPKWFSSIAYIVLFLILNLAAIYILFQNIIYIKIIIGLYAGVLALCGLVIILGNAFGFSKAGYASMQSFKEILSSPFVALFLIPAFYMQNKYSKKS